MGQCIFKSIVLLWKLFVEMSGERFSLTNKYIWIERVPYLSDELTRSSHDLVHDTVRAQRPAVYVSSVKS